MKGLLIHEKLFVRFLALFGIGDCRFARRQRERSLHDYDLVEKVILQ